MNNYPKQSLKYIKFKKRFITRGPLSTSINLKLFINKLILNPISLESSSFMDIMGNRSTPPKMFCMINKFQRSGSITKMLSIDNTQIELIWLPTLTILSII